MYRRTISPSASGSRSRRNRSSNCWSVGGLITRLGYGRGEGGHRSSEPPGETGSVADTGPQRLSFSFMPASVAVIMLHPMCNMTCSFCVTEDAMGSFDLVQAGRLLDRLHEEGFK